jgi:uncharacterized protein (TIGR00255 family)
MIRSMTGYGAAERVMETVRVAVEIRAVNNKFLKVTVRRPEGLGSAEAAIERQVRERISRGTVTVNLTIEPRGAAARAPINTEVLAAYRRDLARLAAETGGGGGGEVPLEALLGLPGVIGSDEVRLTEIENLGAEVEAAVAEALRRLDAMRETEGRATAQDMETTLGDLERGVAAIEPRASEVVEAYRDRLQERVSALLDGMEVPADDAMLVREVAFFAERSDVNEELSRLKSHVSQFRALFEEAGPVGRKLEFLTQEMVREVNTLGSKSSDLDISRQVVDMKAKVDRLREQTQNIE